jgi:peptidoglycan/LPS O-acetylase OafA/YrhL
VSIRGAIATTRNGGLDGLRGLAILLVLGWHLQLPLLRSAGVVGVELFFGLSGYLITSILVREFERTSRISIRSFYLRRALRLLPALIAVIVVAVALAALGAWGDRFRQVTAAAGLSLAYVANWADISGDLSALGHTWSLSVEEQFYLVWPMVLTVGLVRLGRRNLGIVLLVVAAAIALERVWLAAAGDVSFQRLYFGTDTRGDAVLYGAAFALLGVRPHWRVALYAGVAIGCSVMLLFESFLEYFAYALPFVALGSGLIAASSLTTLGWRPLMLVGRISYGLYLWHFLFIWWGLPIPVVLALTFGVAGLSYVVIEQPFLRLKDRIGRPAEAAAAGLAVRTQQPGTAVARV